MAKDFIFLSSFCTAKQTMSLVICIFVWCIMDTDFLIKYAKRDSEPSGVALKGLVVLLCELALNIPAWSVIYLNKQHLIFQNIKSQ